MLEAETKYLFLNLGTPEAPTPDAVGKYLREFLMDPAVMDVPRPLRDFLVKVLIVPRRKFTSAEAYKKIWDESGGSPLLFHSQNFVKKMQAQVSAELGMRYGQPGTASVIRDLVKTGTRKLYIVPLYPQYATSSTETALEEVRKSLKQTGFQGEAYFLETFYSEKFFIESYARQIRKVLDSQSWDHLLFSYHGLPLRHLKELRAECGSPKCCEAPITDARRGRFCYRYQSVQTTKALAQSLGLQADQYSMAFQSRLGPGWIQPFTDKVIAELPKQGVQRLVVACPSFVSDCLETLEEIQMRAAQIFQSAGGETLTLVPCLNAEDHWVQGFVGFLQSYKNWQPL